jgi:hypothetical protein
MKRALFSLLVIALLLVACSSPQKTLSENILGTWKNTDGFTIEFKAGGTGFIPGVSGSIPDTNFTYQITDDSHISIDYEGHANTIEIKIDGDRMTWTDNLGEVSYTRVKEQ